MSKRWVRERKNDFYYRMAKKENYRSRAAYKLIQMDERFRVFREGGVVIDLGASPGGWSQVAAEKVGQNGHVIAVDIKPIESIGGVTFLRGDARAESVKSMVRSALPGGRANVVISDMAPNISGNYSLDHACSIELAEMALDYSELFLTRGGNLVVKVFDGDMAQEFFGKLREVFGHAKRYAPKASRKSSSEIYFICKNKL